MFLHSFIIIIILIKVIDGFRQTGKKSVSWGKNFATVGGIFAGVECLVEKQRAKHDLWNGVTAGCITGASLAYRAGPQAMSFGCAGFATFSMIIDYFMQH